MLKVITKKIPIYHGRLHIVFSTDFNNAIAKLDIPTNGDNAEHYDAFVQKGRDKKDVTQYWVVLRPEAKHYSIAHETVHLVNAIFEDRKIQLDRFNDEPQAYLTGWITQEIYLAKKKAK